MSTYLSDGVVTARNLHQCSLCDHQIQKGESCHTYAGIEDGPVRTWSHHMCWSYTANWKEDDWFYFGGGADRHEIAMQLIAGEY